MLAFSNANHRLTDSSTEKKYLSPSKIHESFNAGSYKSFARSRCRSMFLYFRCSSKTELSSSRNDTSHSFFFVFQNLFFLYESCVSVAGACAFRFPFNESRKKAMQYDRVFTARCITTGVR